MKVVPNDQMDKASLLDIPATPRKHSHQISPNCQTKEKKREREREI